MSVERKSVKVEEWGFGAPGAGRHFRLEQALSVTKAECPVCAWNADRIPSVSERWRAVIGAVEVRWHEGRLYITRYGWLTSERNFVAVIVMKCPDCSTDFFFPVEEPLYVAIRYAAPHWPKRKS